MVNSQLSDSEKIEIIIHGIQNEGIKRVSISWIQRKLRIGFLESSDLRDKLIDMKIIDDDFTLLELEKV